MTTMTMGSLTIVLFAMVIVMRYYTLRQTNSLTHRRLRLENTCTSNQQRYQAAQKARKAAERQEESVRTQIGTVEMQLEELKQEMLEEDKRVSDLEAQLSGKLPKEK